MTPACFSTVTGSAAETAVVPRGDAHEMAGGCPRRLILCIDDDPVILELQRALLHSAGFAAILACDRRLALDQFCRHRPDAVVLDYEIPGTTGAALGTELRRIRRNVPLILNSGCATVPPDEAAQFNYVLPKGLAPALLVQVLRGMFPPPDAAADERGS